jgi:hypothetical protein
MDLRTSSGMPVRFHDARSTLGHLVELYEPTDHLLAHYRLVADLAVGWDGVDPVRWRDARRHQVPGGCP